MASARSDIHYLQSQNGNVYRNRSVYPEVDLVSEFDSLKRDIPEEIPWCSEALGPLTPSPNLSVDSLPDVGLPPDAVNLWIGDSRSVTSVHSGENNKTSYMLMLMDHLP